MEIVFGILILIIMALFFTMFGFVIDSKVSKNNVDDDDNDEEWLEEYWKEWEKDDDWW